MITYLGQQKAAVSKGCCGWAAVAALVHEWGQMPGE